MVKNLLALKNNFRFMFAHTTWTERTKPDPTQSRGAGAMGVPQSAITGMRGISPRLLTLIAELAYTSMVSRGRPHAWVLAAHVARWPPA